MTPAILKREKRLVVWNRQKTVPIKEEEYTLQSVANQRKIYQICTNWASSCYYIHSKLWSDPKRLFPILRSFAGKQLNQSAEVNGETEAYFQAKVENDIKKSKFSKNYIFF